MFHVEHYYMNLHRLLTNSFKISKLFIAIKPLIAISNVIMDLMDLIDF